MAMDCRSWSSPLERRSVWRRICPARSDKRHAQYRGKGKNVDPFHRTHPSKITTLLEKSPLYNIEGPVQKIMSQLEAQAQVNVDPAVARVVLPPPPPNPPNCPRHFATSQTVARKIADRGDKLTLFRR